MPNLHNSKIAVKESYFGYISAKNQCRIMILVSAFGVKESDEHIIKHLGSSFDNIYGIVVDDERRIA